MKAMITSDLHFHPWSLFSKTNSDGVNSRLQIVIDEFVEAAKELERAGGKTIFIAGDVFHTRGALDPETLNPVRDAFQRVIDMGIDIYIIPGNHDLKSSDTRRISSAVENLAQVSISGSQVRVINKVEHIAIDGALFGFVPWRKNNEAMLEDLEELSKVTNHEKMHVFIHAGIDGVLSGVPASGLTAAKLTSFFFRGVYAGHYHNHADMTHPSTPGLRVMSIGASTHQNWGDIGSKAGFLMIDTEKNEVTFNDAKAPKFIDISGMSEEDMEIEVAGNYARFRGPQMTQDQINEFRDTLTKWGALGTSIEVPRAISAARPSSAPTTGLTLDQSVDKFVGEMSDVPAHVDKAEISRRALEVLNDTRAVSS